jgi:hypothetical protein
MVRICCARWQKMEEIHALGVMGAGNGKAKPAEIIFIPSGYRYQKLFVQVFHFLMRMYSSIGNSRCQEACLF